MLEMVKTLLNLGADLVTAAAGVIFSIMSTSFDLLIVLHNDMPRIEGMLVGLGIYCCLLYTSPSPRDATLSRMPSSA